MTQGLQISMQMTGTDTLLKSDSSALTEAEPDGQDSIFGELLGSMVQPAKSGQTDKAARQLPAGISVLSELSRALLQATEQETTPELATIETDDNSMLTASILEQIALKGAAQPEAEGTDSKMLSGVNQMPGEEEGESLTQVENDVASDNAGIAKQIAAKQIAASDEAAQLTKTGLSPSGNQLSLNTLANIAGEKATETDQAHSKAAKAQSNAGLSDKVAEKQQFTGNSILSSLTNKDKPDPTIPQPPVIDTSEGADSDALIIEHGMTAEPEAGQLELSAQLQLPDADTATPVKLATVDKAIKKQAAADLTEQQVKATGSVHSLVTPAAAEHGSLSVKAAEHDSLNNTTPGTDKAMTGALPEKSPSAKGSSADSEQASQQQQRQQQMAQQFNDKQMHEGNITANSKNSAEPATLRHDAMFSNSLQTAEQRQVRNITEAQKQPAGQLKQSLNLLQQDAATNLRERVNLMVRQNIQVAEIRLDPAGLGQMQIKIDMQQEQAAVQFIVQQPQAKELLEQQLPRLREMLQQQGIILSEGNVQQQSQQQERQLAQQHSQDNGARQQGADELPEGHHADSAVQVTANVSERLVDYYA